jgi:hypothetical protein
MSTATTTTLSERTKTYIAMLSRTADVDPALASAIRRAVFGDRVSRPEATALITALRQLAVTS